MAKKQFRKQNLNNGDYARIEQGAKALKGAAGIVTCAAILLRNKQNLKILSNNIIKLTGQIVSK